jgi:hypothetical protein
MEDVRVPGAISAFTRVFDALWQHDMTINTVDQRCITACLHRVRDTRPYFRRNT